MTVVVSERTALEPLVEDLLRRAHAEADELVGAAEEEGRDALGEARRQVEEALRVGVEEGRAEGAARATAEVATARRRARTQLLEAEAAVHEELRALARQAVSEVLALPGRRARLEGVLRARLDGPVTIHPTADGGLEAVAEDGRTVSASVATLADRALEQLDVDELWATS